MFQGFSLWKGARIISLLFYLLKSNKQSIHSYIVTSIWNTSQASLKPITLGFASGRCCIRIVFERPREGIPEVASEMMQWGKCVDSTDTKNLYGLVSYHDPSGNNPLNLIPPKSGSVVWEYYRNMFSTPRPDVLASSNVMILTYIYIYNHTNVNDVFDLSNGMMDFLYAWKHILWRMLIVYMH